MSELPNLQNLQENSRVSFFQEKREKLHKPSWLKIRLPYHRDFFSVAEVLKEKDLHTICQSAKCPNVSRCWSAKTATFLILGDTCTRNCAFCAVKKGSPGPLDPEEPERVAEAVCILELDYAVVTSVTRDDLPDGGASVFAATIRTIKENKKGVKVEVLIPDFQGSAESLAMVLEAQPDVLNHNLETTETRYPFLRRPRENYRRSLALLAKSKASGALTKSGLMIGLGEKEEEIVRTFSDLRRAGCDLLTIGQYLQPTRESVPVLKYYAPQEFEQLKNVALDFGFADVEAGPLVRSSFEAHRLYKTSRNRFKGAICAT